MNYILKVDNSKVDKVILKLSELDIKITNIIRSTGTIHVKTKFEERLNEIKDVINVKKEGFFPQLLLF